MKKIRTFPGYETVDEGAISNIEYSKAAGAKKVSEVGRHLLPLDNGSGGFTTDATTVKKLPSQGRNLAIYNKSSTVESVNLGETGSITSLGVGITDSTGHCGIPCTPNQWTYVACAEQDWVITSSANLVVFLIDDDTAIKVSVS